MMQRVADSLQSIRDKCLENSSVPVSDDAEIEKQKCIEKVRDESEIPVRFRDAVLSGFRGDPLAKDALEAANSLAGRHFKSPGLGVCGPVGVGKTRLLSAIANAAIQCEKRAVVITTTDLVLRLKDTFRNRDDSELSVISSLVRTPVLCVDDLGKEQITEWSSQVLFEAINARYNAGLSLVVAANSSLQQLWESKYSRVVDGVDPNLMLSVIDKIREMTGPWVWFTGKSKRRA